MVLNLTEDIMQILPTLLPLLSSAAPISIFSAYKEPLMEAHAYFNSNGYATNVQLREIWTREYQVLPNRTHPMMTTSAHSGYILSAITIVPRLPIAGVTEEEDMDM
eukprot:TRINITY_DN5761_c0_g1_i3.p1 TRINITY_DN5761_c0_g1~~TRINITY_DN5761_c0_g1_i3.p1  ORF type:complete len:106 (+),score=22.32 TRINITY_DN5761_c0_g1_i3:221-538(+)